MTRPARKTLTVRGATPLELPELRVQLRSASARDASRVGLASRAPRASRLAGSLAVVASSVLAFFAAPACSDPVTEHPCTSIPSGGCPLSRGVACEDPTCEAVYACRPGNVWELDHTCPAHEAGEPHDAATETAPPIRDGAIDAPPGANGGPGCGPLQAPDCMLGFALVCPSGCCDCEDLFVCQNGGWVTWGTCSLDAGIREGH
jgi:hypothetical protein